MKKYRKLCSLLLAIALLVAGSSLSVAAKTSGDEGDRPARVLVGGMPFGVKFYTEGILVVGFCEVDVAAAGRSRSPARDAGLHERDVITAINGVAPTSAQDLCTAAEQSGGKPLSLTVKRVVRGTAPVAKKGAERPAPTETTLTVSVTPLWSASEGRYKTGMWVRDSGAGIGTVTFIIPESGAFAGLGHGICDGDTGELIPMGRGQVTDVTVSGVDKGAAGAPGAIKGYFAPGKTGSLLGNTPCGVYGLFTTLPAGAVTQLPLGSVQELCEGDATVLCTTDDGAVREYRVRLSGIDRTATGSKCFTVTVTDPALIERTGGIVQGMSGSPIIQNGRLVGAVTHVLINDPTTGYGIFAVNMLRDMPELLR